MLEVLRLSEAILAHYLTPHLLLSLFTLLCCCCYVKEIKEDGFKAACRFRNSNTSVGFRIESKVRTKDQGEDSSSSEVGILGTAAIASGLISSPVIGWSLYTLKTTGCGLPPGPGGSIGALEGISYLVVIGIVSWSLVTKARTGTGLPNGPYGLLGAVEGLSYLALLAIVVVFGLQFLYQGFIPGPLPGDQCYG